MQVFSCLSWGPRVFLCSLPANLYCKSTTLF
nr:MAG TPA: Poxviridae B3 protein [Caudoviricetes sp.]